MTELIGARCFSNLRLGICREAKFVLVLDISVKQTNFIFCNAVLLLLSIIILQQPKHSSPVLMLVKTKQFRQNYRKSWFREAIFIISS